VPVAQRQIEGILRTAKSSVIGKHSLADFVNANPQDLKFDAIEKEIELVVQSELRTNNYGIQVEFLGFKKIGLPESVTQTVFQRMTSERQVQISDLQYKGEAEAQKIKSAADRKAADTISQATAAATRIEGEGVAEAAKVLPVFQQNPELANFLLRVDSLKQSLNQRATLIFDERTPPFDLFRNLPTNPPSR
jgi:membrane protease subunit HflC